MSPDTAGDRAFTWICPACGRSVPRSVDACRCGAGRPSGTALEPEREQAGSSSFPLALTGAAIVTVTVAAWYGIAWTRPDPLPGANGSARIERAAPVAAAPAEPGAPPVLEWPADAPVVQNDESAGAAAAAPLIVASAPVLASRPVEDVVASATPAVVLVESASGRGTGFFVSSDRVVTNAHVVQQAGYVTVVASDGRRLAARVITLAQGQDLALLGIADARSGQAVLPLGTLASVRVGQEVLAIGSPLGFQNTVTRGIVSALRRAGDVALVQTDAAINPGNSGGPLLDRGGRVIAVTTMKVSGSAESLGFGVSVDHVRQLLEGTAPAGAAAPLLGAGGPGAAGIDGGDSDARAEADAEYERTLVDVARRADALDREWERFVRTCLPREPHSSGDRPWFALWDRNFSPAAVSPACLDFYQDYRRTADTLRTRMAESDETARRAGVFPGTRRTLRERYRLAWEGWDR